MTKKDTLSPEQIIAAEPTENVWVQANAGTGKTSVLTARLLRILFRSDETKPGAILCLTYTNAAAGEMKNRILGALRDWAMADKETLRDLLVGVTINQVPTDADIAHARRVFFYYIDNPDILKIKTIHSFCEEILRRFPIEAGISPSWSLISDAPQRVLLHDAFDMLVNSDKNDARTVAAFNYIVGISSEYKFDDLLKVIEQQYKHFFTVSDFNNYRDYFIETIQKKLNLHPRKAMNFVPDSLKNIIECAKNEKKPTKALTSLINLSEQFIDKTIDFEKYKMSYLTAAGRPKTGLNYDFLKDEKLRVLEQNIQNVGWRIFDNTMALFDLSAAFAKTYIELKHSRNVLDFEDLILYTHRLFSNPETMGWVLSQLDLSLSHILVDEAQDTSPIQWELLQMLAGDFFTDGDTNDLPHSLFVVGDTKQSIYGFQGADPKAFAQSRTEISSYIKNNARQIREVPLTQSFRSVQPILSVVDDFFGNPNVSAATGFINNPHKCFRIGEKGCVEIFKSVRASKDNPIQSVRKKYISDIADKIQNVITNTKYTEKDIMILVQERNPFVPLLSSELKRRGLDVTGSDRVVLPNYPIIKDLMNLLRFCINLRNDYALGCVLKSPLFGLNDAVIYDICKLRNQENISAHKNSQEKIPLLEFVRRLHPDKYAILMDFVARSTVDGPYTFFSYVLNHYGIREKMIAALGNQIIDPLQEFITICLVYERTRPGTLRHFIKWFITGASEVKRDMESGTGICIVTVHSSKGLQAPVVFLIDTMLPPRLPKIYDIPSKSDLDRRAVWIWTEHKPKEYCPGFDEIEDTIKSSDTEESFRLLYVAMTRARDMLYIYGLSRTETPPELSWHNMLWTTLTQAYNVSNESEKIRVSND